MGNRTQLLEMFKEAETMISPAFFNGLAGAGTGTGCIRGWGIVYLRGDLALLSPDQDEHGKPTRPSYTRHCLGNWQVCLI